MITVNNTSKAVNSYIGGMEGSLCYSDTNSIFGKGLGVLSEKKFQELNWSFQTKQIFATVLTLSHTLRISLWQSKGLQINLNPICSLLVNTNMSYWNHSENLFFLGNSLLKFAHFLWNISMYSLFLHFIILGQKISFNLAPNEQAHMFSPYLLQSLAQLFVIHINLGSLPFFLNSQILHY